MSSTFLMLCYYTLDYPDKPECKCIQDKGMNDPICFRVSFVTSSFKT